MAYGGTYSGFRARRDEGYLQGCNTTLKMSDLMSRCQQGPRATRELDNLINLNWWAGRPYFRRIPTTNSIIGLNPDRRMNFVYANLAFDTERALTGVMAYEPTAEASPSTDDQEDIARAQVDGELANAGIRNGHLPRAYRAVCKMDNQYGHGWIKCAWDPLAGSSSPQMNQVPCPTCRMTGVVPDHMGQPRACPTCTAQAVQPGPHQTPQAPGFVTKFEGMRPEGDVSYLPVHPDDMFTDPDAKNPGVAEELVHQIRMSPETAWRTYGDKLGLPQEMFDQAMAPNSTGSAYSASISTQLLRPTNQRYITVREYYACPSGKYQQGIFAIFLGEQEIYAGPLPYLHDGGKHWHPFFYFPMYATEELYYPMGTLDLVLPLIISYNEFLSTKSARAKLEARLRMMYPEQSRMRLEDGTGHLVYLDRPGRGKPEPLSLAAYPQSALQMEEVLLDMIDRLSGATDVVRGQSQNADSARALTFLEEKALGPLRPVIDEHATVLGEMIRYSVDLMRIFYEDGRIIRRVGASGSQACFEFRAENVGNSDVQLVAARDIGRSRASKMDELTEAFKIGAITQEDFKKYSEFGDIQEMRKDDARHAQFAMQENRMLLTQGIIPEPLPGQKHRVHNDVHDKKIVEMQSRDPNDPLIPWMVHHRQMHVQMEAQEAIAPQMAQQVAMQNYGAANAANGAMQPQETQAAVNAQPGGPTAPQASAEPFQGAQAAPPGQSQQYQDNSAAARQYDHPPQG